MTASGRSPSSALFIVAFLITVMIVSLTFVHNREIAARRLAVPVPVVGNLIKAYCTSFTRGGGKGGTHHKPVAILEYAYITIEEPTKRHVFTTTQGFDTPELCPAYLEQLGSVASLWYDQTNPAKASLHKFEPNSFFYLRLLALPALLLMGGLYARRSEMRKSKTKVRQRKRK